MKISPDTPIGTIVLHETFGCRVLRLNGTIQQQFEDSLPGWPHRVVVVDFCGDWKYMREDEQYMEILPAFADVARA